MSAFARRVGKLFSSGAVYYTPLQKIVLQKSLPLVAVQTIPWAPTITPDVANGEVVIVGQLEGNLTVNSVGSPIVGQAMELHFTQGNPARTVTFSSAYQQPVGAITPSTPGAQWTVRFRWLGSWMLESTAAVDGRFTFYVNGWGGSPTAQTAGAATPRLVNHTQNTWLIDRWGIDANVSPGSGGAIVTYGFDGASNSGSFTLPFGSNNIWYETGDLPTPMAPGSYIRAWLTTVNSAQDVNFSISGRLA